MQASSHAIHTEKLFQEETGGEGSFVIQLHCLGFFTMDMVKDFAQCKACRMPFKKVGTSAAEHLLDCVDVLVGVNLYVVCVWPVFRTWWCFLSSQLFFVIYHKFLPLC